MFGYCISVILETSLLYILAGPDDFSLHQALDEIKRGLGDAEVLASSTTVLDGQQVAADEVKQVCETVPFLSEKRLVIIRGLIGRLEAKGRGEHAATGRTAPPDPARFLVCLGGIPDTTVVVMTEDDVPKAGGVFKELLNKAAVRSFPLLKEAELRPWVQKRVGAAGGSISPQAVNLICQLVGSNLWIMAGEIEKLVLFAGDRRIEEAEVRALVGYTQDISVFALIDAIVDFRAEQAGQALQQLLQHGAAPVYLLFMLDRQFRMIIRAKELKDRNVPEAAMQSKLGVFNEYVFRRTLQQADRYTAPRLKQIYRQLLDADLAMKTGRYDGELALELVVAELSRRPAAAAAG